MPTDQAAATRPDATVGPSHQDGPPLIGFAVVLGSAALFGMLGPLSRFAYEAGMEPAAFVFWRALIGFLILALVVGWRSRSGAARLVRFQDMSRRSRLTLFVAAVAGFTLNLCMFIAFDRITVALALLGFYTYPAMLAVANVVMGREPLDRPRIVALGLALVGMIAVVASQLDPAAGIRLDAIGIGLALGAALSQTVYVIVSRDGYRMVPTEQAIAAVLLVTVVGAGILAVVGGSPGSIVQPIVSPAVLPLLLFTGLFTAAIPSLGFLSGIRWIGGLRAGILMLFEPVVGVALAAWLLDEALAPVQLAGAIAILGAAVILQRATRTTGATQAGAPDDAPIVVPVGP
ncbi:MAG: DMT family transporter [Candidatus Limnocylindrales bacterium]